MYFSFLSLSFLFFFFLAGYFTMLPVCDYVAFSGRKNAELERIREEAITAQ